MELGKTEARERGRRKGRERRGEGREREEGSMQSSRNPQLRVSLQFIRSIQISKLTKNSIKKEQIKIRSILSEGDFVLYKGGDFCCG